MQIGTLAPIEVVRAQSVVATNQQALIVAQTNLQLQQLLMKNANPPSQPAPPHTIIPPGTLDNGAR